MNLGIHSKSVSGGKARVFSATLRCLAGFVSSFEEG
jgi:hypothetical protein